MPKDKAKKKDGGGKPGARKGSGASRASATVKTPSKGSGAKDTGGKRSASKHNGSAPGGSQPRLADIRKGSYTDGSPLDDVHYLECKVILKPDRFTSARSFLDYGKVVQKAAEEQGIAFSLKDASHKPQQREVIFLDTHDFKLYNNAFILRRRIQYEYGFPVGDPEIVFKYRHPDAQRAAEVDVRPRMPGKYLIKFKAEALPLKDKPGGYRLLYSHNAQFGASQAPQGDRTPMTSFTRVFPAMANLRKSDTDRLELVNQVVIEEILQPLGDLDFGKGVTAECDVAIWRTRSDHRPIVGEFSFQCKFKKRDELHDKTMDKVKTFYAALQRIGPDWVALGLTKTAAVYRLKGNPPQHHE